LFLFTVDYAAGVSRLRRRSTRRAVRRSQTYEVEVFDQIPTRNETYLVRGAAADAGGQCDPTELRKALQDQMGDVADRRLHHAAEAMLELGGDKKMTWSASRSFRNL